MKLRDVFISSIAATALAIGTAQGVPAWGEGHQPAQKTSQTTGKKPAAAAKQQQKESSLTTVRSLTYDPLIPLGAIGGLAGLYGAACLLAERRKMRGAWLRAAAGGIVVLTLVNPEIRREQHERLPTEVAIIVDRSASQSLDGRDRTTDAMQAALLSELSKIKDVKARIIDVGGDKNGAAADGTNLFGALDALSDIPPERLGGVIMLTDGEVHDIPANHKSLGADVPLHVLVSGHEGEYDRRIVIDNAPRFGLIDKSQKISFRVVDNGTPAAGAGGKVRVTVTSQGKILATEMVTPGQPSEISVDIAHAGTNLIEFKTDAVAGELTAVNNRAVASIEGIRRALNVLLVCGEPNENLRLWRGLLKSDPDTNLVNLCTLRPPQKEDETPLKELSLIPFPANDIFGPKIDKFDLIIFDQYKYDGLLPDKYFGNIAQRVKAGGALLVLSGPEYDLPGSLAQTELASVLPAMPTGAPIAAPFQPKITETGERHPVTRDLDGGAPDQPPWGRWLSLANTTAPASQVAMEGPNHKPLLVLGHEGKGRTAMLQSDSVWLWMHGFDGGGPYEELLGRMTRWLMQDPAMDEESLRITRADGTLTVERQTMDDKTPPMTVRTPSGKTVTLTPEKVAPGLWRATMPANELGLYSAQQGGVKALESFANVGPANPKEFVDTLSTTGLLKPFVDDTGGYIARMNDNKGKLEVPKIVTRDAGDTHKPFSGPGWLAVKTSDITALKNVSRQPVVPAWLSLLLGMGLLTGAWLRESGQEIPNPFGKKSAPGPSP